MTTLAMFLGYVLLVQPQDPVKPDPIPIPAERQDDQDVLVKFQFKDAPVAEVIKYAAKVTGYKILDEAKVRGKVTAWSDSKIPKSHVLAFLDSALQPKYALVKMGPVVKVLKYEDAMKRTLDIRVTAQPEDVPQSDQVLTVIYPLKNLNVVEVNKELDDLYPRNADVLINTYSNTLIITGRSDEIHKMMLVLSKIDVEAKENVVLKVFVLQNADATEMAKLLTGLFINKDNNQRDPFGWGGMMRMMMRGGRGGGSSIEAKEVASEVVRIAADVRVNAVIVVATEENVKLIGGVIKDLDRSSGSVKVAVYVLQFADAESLAQLLEDLFEQKNSSNRQQNQGGGRGRAWWRGGGRGQQQTTQGGAPTDLRAVADARTNTIVVTGSEQQLAIVDELMKDFDKPMTELLSVRVFKLRHADAMETATQIREMFDDSSTANSGNRNNRNQRGGRGGRQNQRFQGQPTSSSSMLPSQQVEVVADARTNSVIVKASVEYMAVIADMVRQLDAQKSENESIIVYRVRHGDAYSLVQSVRSIATGQGVQRQPWANPFSQFQQGRAGGQNQQNPFGTRGNTNRASRGGGGRGRQLGPMDDQDFQDPTFRPPSQDEYQDEPGGLTGTLTVESDPSTNTLIIRTSERNRAALMQLLDELDRARPQVLIKCRIVDVSVDDALALGVEGSIRAGEFTFSTDFAEFNPQRVGDGAFTIDAGDADYSLRLQALAREGKVKVLATPSVLVLDNEIAEITIGREVPFIDQTQQTPQGGTLNTIRYEDIGVILYVQPHINPNGKVTMAVHPEVSDIDETRSVPISEGVTSPTFTKNAVTTMINVRNGQTVIIGGLIRESDEEIRQKVPLLGDIPLLGALFSRTDTVKTKRELMIFLTPYVIYSERQLEELHEVEKASLKLISAKDIGPEGRRWRSYMWR